MHNTCQEECPEKCALGELEQLLPHHDNTATSSSTRGNEGAESNVRRNVFLDCNHIGFVAMGFLQYDNVMAPT